MLETNGIFSPIQLHSSQLMGFLLVCDNHILEYVNTRSNVLIFPWIRRIFNVLFSDHVRINVSFCWVFAYRSPLFPYIPEAFLYFGYSSQSI